ncbi:DUF2164 domain-containing protein [Paenibacillus faecalis]|uniref:DUF2164 domain-containing protein n=1 Tax=Paenibacillus faecalis TaxID=2079532 RepID=UPI000D1109BA|nr:DUF2164 domain-containing protein [Paenibacillus faecalis]
MKPIKFPKEERERIIQQIQDYFEEEHDASLGHLAADNMLEFFMTRISPYIYNQALEDCRQLVAQRMLSLEDDIYALEQPVGTVR